MGMKSIGLFLFIYYLLDYNIICRSRWRRCTISKFTLWAAGGSKIILAFFSRYRTANILTQTFFLLHDIVKHTLAHSKYFYVLGHNVQFFVCNSGDEFVSCSLSPTENSRQMFFKTRLKLGGGIIRNNLIIKNLLFPPQTPHTKFLNSLLFLQTTSPQKHMVKSRSKSTEEIQQAKKVSDSAIALSLCFLMFFFFFFVTET